MSRNNYEIKITGTKSKFWKKLAFDSTVRFDTNIPNRSSYILEHSPLREEEYCIEMKNIPSFVSVHFVRHGIGVRHYVLSCRDDRGGTGDEGRWSPVNHTMVLNAEALINIARKRLCYTSHKETRYIMFRIKKQIQKKNFTLSKFLVPNCVYRNGLCKEMKGSCGYLKEIMRDYSYYKEMFV